MTSSIDRPGRLVRLTDWSIHHKRIAIGGWLVALLVAMAASHAANATFVDRVSLPGTDSERARALLAHDFPQRAGDTDLVVLHVSHGSVSAPAVRSQVVPALRRIAALPHVSRVVQPGAPGTVSADGRTAFATIRFDDEAHLLPTDAVKRVVTTARATAGSGLQVELAGEAIRQAQRPSLGAATAIGLLAAMVVLLFTFGSLAAMGLPIITALLGLGTAMGLIGIGAKALDTPDFATQLAAMIGLGVGIDYALFVVTRFRERYARDGDVEASIREAMDTAGRAVAFAGATVIIALLGMFVLGLSLLYGVALSAAAAVLLTMLAALTVLPALLARFGRRIGQSHARRAAASGGIWPRWAAAVTRHPTPALLAGLAVMVALSIPALSLRLGQRAAGCTHHRSGQASARSAGAAARAEHTCADLRWRAHRHLGRFQSLAWAQAAAVHCGSGAARGVAAGGRLPLRADSAAGRADEPAHDLRIAGRGGRGVPEGLAGRALRRQGRPDRGLHSGLGVRDRLRALDGLRGLFDLADP